MKTFVKIFIMTLIATIAISGVIPTSYAAASYKVELSGASSAKPGEEFSLTISVKDLVDIGGTSNGLTVVTAKLDFDANKLEVVSAFGTNGFFATLGTHLLIDSSTGISTNTDIATITFKVKTGAATGDTTVKLTDISSSNGTNNISANDAEKKISITSLSDNTIKSSNTNLAGIAIDSKPLAEFAKDTTTYTLPSVPNDKIGIQIAAVAEDSKSIVSGIGSKELTVGLNTFDIQVTAEDGSTKIYTINVERLGTEQKDEVAPPVEEDLPETGLVDWIPAILILFSITALISYRRMRKCEQQIKVSCNQ